jgi:predicted dehydrogenase
MFNPVTKLAIVGYGYWGKKVYKVLEDKIKIRALICDKNKADLPTGSKQIVWDELIKRQDIKNIFIATPEETHYQLSKSLLKVNKNVFVEKPLALLQKEAGYLCRVATQQSSRLFCDYIFLFDSYAKKIKQMLGENEIGNLVRIESYRHSKGFYKPNIAVSDDLLIHDLYLGELFFGENVIKATNKKNILQEGSRTLSTKYELSFKKKKKLISYCSWVEDLPKREIILIGTKGKIYWRKNQGGKDSVILERENGEEIILIKEHISALEEGIHFFLNSITTETEEQTSQRYQSYIRHTSMLESVRA